MTVSINLEGRVALVTGSARGIGRACALLLAEAGADVIVNYRANRAAGEAVAERIGQMGRETLLVQADTGQTQDVEAMVARALDKFGKVDILVSNAGAGTPYGVAETTD
ncbi:MAG TPA: SDR family NAD(P)-dependent oxidoreductase, partial [Chloroflexota bacterium]|nr:SDR family NAD(P)-dependent oxidoreductase [Chloroflexota bacterium]